MPSLTENQNWDVTVATLWRSKSDWKIKAEYMFAYMILYRGYDNPKAGDAAVLYEIAMAYHYRGME